MAVELPALAARSAATHWAAARSLTSSSVILVPLTTAAVPGVISPQPVSRSRASAADGTAHSRPWRTG